MIALRIMVILAGLVLFASISRADYLADRLPASGKPENKLAGTHLTERTRLREIIKRYGKPTRVKSWESGNPNWSNQYEYYWQKPGLNLRVVVERLPQKIPAWEYISLIEANVGTSAKVGTTGRGLRIGQSLTDIRRLYGRRFKLRDIPKLKIHDVMFQWRQEEYSLVATLDSRNRIVGLSLSAPE